MLARPDLIERGNAVDMLREFILQGGYEPGDRLPSERALIGQLGVSRTTLRKALDGLEAEGAIWRHVGKGTFVSASLTALPSTGAALVGSWPPGLHELARELTPVKMMRARLCIEPAIAREAAINASSGALNRMKIARDRARNAQSWDEYEAEDDKLHRAVADASDNILLLSLFDQLNSVRRAVAWESVVRKSPKPAADHSSFAEHDLILDAVERRDPLAAQDAMRRHIGSVSARLFGES